VQLPLLVAMAHMRRKCFLETVMLVGKRSGPHGRVSLSRDSRLCNVKSSVARAAIQDCEHI